MSTNDLLSLLQCVRPTSRGWSARCAAHPDTSPSLSIREAEDGRILLHCFAGCSTQAVCDALHIPLRELFGPAPRDSKEIQCAREQRELKRRKQERAQLERNALADAQRRSNRLITSAKHVPIDHWNEAFLDLMLNRLADAYELIGDRNGEK